MGYANALPTRYARQYDKCTHGRQSTRIQRFMIVGSFITSPTILHEAEADADAR